MYPLGYVFVPKQDEPWGEFIVAAPELKPHRYFVEKRKLTA
jgi:hypothetical protein